MLYFVLYIQKAFVIDQKFKIEYIYIRKYRYYLNIFKLKFHANLICFLFLKMILQQKNRLSNFSESVIVKKSRVP